MLSPTLTFVALDALRLKYGLVSSMPWPELIQASGILATFAALIEVAMKLIFGNCAN
jgi:hypothetical protein